jgi:hypothetical protein
MWFRRKSTNRRLKSDLVLDVRLSTEKIRAQRMRVATAVLTICFGAALVLFLAWRGTDWALNEFIFQNSAFALETIDVQTDGVIAAEPLRKWAEVNPGDNLLALDLARIKRDLELVPLIRSAAVERVLPRTLRLRVAEREPVAFVTTVRPGANAAGYGQVVFLLDAEGCVIPPLAPSLLTDAQAQRTDLLPRLIGLNPVELRPGRRVESPQARAALRLIGEFDRSAMAGLADLKLIDVGAPETLRTTTEQGSEVTFAANDSLGAQLSRWRVAYDLGARNSRAIRSLDLSISNNIPARWLEASLALPSTPKAVKPARSKKKNV